MLFLWLIKYTLLITNTKLNYWHLTRFKWIHALPLIYPYRLAETVALDCIVPLSPSSIHLTAYFLFFWFTLLTQRWRHRRLGISDLPFLPLVISIFIASRSTMYITYVTIETSSWPRPSVYSVSLQTST